MNLKINSFLFILIIVCACACACADTAKEQTILIPDNLKNIENLSVFSISDQKPDSVILDTATIFGNLDDIIMEEFINEFVIDDSGNVYIAAKQMGSNGIYVFDSDGNYINRFAEYGRGPAEYESIQSIDIHDNRLYIYDTVLFKYGVFSLEGFSHIKDQVISKQSLGEADSLALMYRIKDLIVLENERFILKMSMIPRSIRFPNQKELFYELNDDGLLRSGKILELKGLSWYHSQNSIVATPFLMPFNRSQLVSISKDGLFYTAWSEDFLIKIYDSEGQYTRSYYYPMKKAPLRISDVNMERQTKRSLQEYKLPNTWPLLHTMEIDDENRIWVSTITENENTFKWWVLSSEGSIIATFSLPGNRNSRSPYRKPLIQIKKGFFYEYEYDYQKNLNQIVKYKIEFESR